MGRKYSVTVATSDALEQVIILGQGALRVSADGLREEIELMLREIRSEFLQGTQEGKNYLFDYAGEELAESLESLRLGEDV